jgi:hypothetical protein
MFDGRLNGFDTKPNAPAVAETLNRPHQRSPCAVYLGDPGKIENEWGVLFASDKAAQALPGFSGVFIGQWWFEGNEEFAFGRLLRFEGESSAQEDLLSIGWLFTLVDFLSENTGALEGNHAAGWENNGVSGLGIAAPALVFFFYAEFAEPAYQHVFTLLKSIFNYLEKSVDNLGWFGLCKNVFGKQVLDDVGLGQRHKNFLSFQRHRSKSLLGLDFSVLLNSHKLLKDYSPVFKKKKGHFGLEPLILKDKIAFQR